MKDTRPQCGCKCGCSQRNKSLFQNKCLDCNRSNHYNVKTGQRTQLGFSRYRRLSGVYN